MKKIVIVMLLIAALGDPVGTAVAQPAGAGTDPTAHDLYVTAYRVAQQAARGAEDPAAALRALQERITAKAAYIQQELQKTQETSR